MDFRNDDIPEIKLAELLEQVKYLVEGNTVTINQTIENEFLKAAKLGELSTLENIIEVHGNKILKLLDADKNNALHLSAEFGTLGGTTFLVEKHYFDIYDRTNEYCQNAFLLSAKRGNTGGFKMNFLIL